MNWINTNNSNPTKSGKYIVAVLVNKGSEHESMSTIPFQYDTEFGWMDEHGENLNGYEVHYWMKYPSPPERNTIVLK